MAEGSAGIIHGHPSQDWPAKPILPFDLFVVYIQSEKEVTHETVQPDQADQLPQGPRR